MAVVATPWPVDVPELPALGDWIERIACADATAQMFFSVSPRCIEAAKRICAGLSGPPVSVLSSPWGRGLKADAGHGISEG